MILKIDSFIVGISPTPLSATIQSVLFVFFLSCSFGLNAQTSTGDLQLQIKYVDPPQAAETFENNADVSLCGSLLEVERMEVDATQGLKEAIAWLLPEASSKTLVENSETEEWRPEELNIANCRLDRRAVVLQTGQALQVKSKDLINYQLLFATKMNPQFSLSLPPNLQMRTLSFKNPEIFEMRETIHPHLTAYIFVSQTKLVGQANASGDLKISKIPFGEYKLSIWHPALGIRSHPSVVQIDSSTRRMEIRLRQLSN